MKNTITFAVLTMIALFSFGCGPSNPYKTVPVKGSVLVDGQPMAGVNVAFTPESSDGHSAYGSTDAKGEFRLTIAGAPTDSGAEPGTYYVTFQKTTMTERPTASTPEEQAALEEKFPIEVIHVIPEKYSRRKENGIYPVTVEKGKDNVFTFQISTK